MGARPAGAKLVNPETREPIEVSESVFLGQLAENTLGRKYKAQALYKGNRNFFALGIAVPAGTTLKNPETKKEFKVEKATTLGPLAKEVLGTPDKADDLYSANADKLKSPFDLAAAQLPAEAQLFLPQRDWPALLAFAALIATLLAVGAGYLFKAAKET